MPQRNAVFAATLVDALHRSGVHHACVTPGSRSTPLAVALSESAVIDWSHHDERSSAFFALGLARATGRPVLVVTTSGTAAAELHPALVEARHGRVPLIAVTADRPFELRDVGAPQTIDQQGLFGPTVLWSHDTAVPDPTQVAPAHVAALAARLVLEATGPPAGPVHLNLRFREPLITAGPVAAEATVVPRVHPVVVAPGPESVAEVAAAVAGRRGVLVAGPIDDPGIPEAAARFAAAMGWPILADPLSGLRRGPHDRGKVLAASDALGWAGWIDRADPDVVVRVGALPTSKPVARWLEAHRDRVQVLVDPTGWRDPTASATHVVRADPTLTLEALAGLASPTAPQWIERWLEADRTAAAALHGFVDAEPFPNEPAVARLVAEAAPEGSTLWVASSMPVRDIDAVLLPGGRTLTVRANRGANGIDGFLSTVLGWAAASGAATALSGDLSLLHDIGALATARRLGLPVRIVVIDNDGGGIFHLLPQAGHPAFERHWGTPHGLDLTAIAAAFGVPAETVTTADRLSRLLEAPPEGPSLVRIPTDRAANADLHRRMRASVAAALGGQSDE